MNAADLTTGSVVDRYTISRVLGEGGMAIVYQVEHNQLGSQHALKVLTIASRQVRERLLLEGRAQATLRHPNVVTVTDVVDIGGSPGLIMELIEGPSLDDYLDAEKLSVEQVDHLARGILAGVAAAHDAGLVHRDLKPANIMLSIAAGGLQPKVTDFGLAKIVAQGDQSKTRTGSTMGTPHYMSPEQIDDSKNVGPATDIWALGAILYEMITGVRAFPGDNLLEIFSAVNQGTYVPVDQHVPDVPERMKKAIEAALQRDPEARPATVRELFELWAGGEEGVASSAPPMGPWNAQALSQARSMARGPSSSDDQVPGSGETLADAKSNSMLGGSATLIGLGGTVVGIGALAAIAALAVVVAIGAVYWALTREAEVEVVQLPGEVQVIQVPTEPGAAEPASGATTAPKTPRPQPTGAAPDPDTQPGEPAPTATTDEGDPTADEAEEDAAPEVDAAERAPEPVTETPTAAEGAEATDTGAAVAEADVEAPAADTGGGVTLGLLESPDASVRYNSVKRKLGSPNEDTSRALFELFKKEQVSKVKMAALQGLVRLWDEDKGHWQTNNEAMIYAMSQGSSYAIPAAEAFGRNGQDPNGLLPALKHSDPRVRKAAVEAAGLVIPRAPSGFDGRAFLEPYASDSDSSVAKAAQKILKNL